MFTCYDIQCTMYEQIQFTFIITIIFFNELKIEWKWKI